jgi:phage shock protein A
MTAIDNIMALVDRYAAGIERESCAEIEHRYQALRTAIEQALKLEQLNYAGCMEDLADAEKLESYAKAMHESDTALLRQALEALEYHVEQTRPIEQTSEAIAALKDRLK